MLSTDKELYFIFRRALLKLLLKAIWTSFVNPIGKLIYWTNSQPEIDWQKILIP